MERAERRVPERERIAPGHSGGIGLGWKDSFVGADAVEEREMQRANGLG